MRIRMKTTLAGPGRQAATPGQIVELSEKEGGELVAGGYAEALTTVHAQKDFELQRRKVRAGAALELSATEIATLGNAVSAEAPAAGQPSAADLDAVEKEKQAAEKTRAGAQAPESHSIAPPEHAVQPPAPPRPPATEAAERKGK